MLKSYHRCKPVSKVRPTESARLTPTAFLGCGSEVTAMPPMSASLPQSLEHRDCLRRKSLPGAASLARTGCGTRTLATIPGQPLQALCCSRLRRDTASQGGKAVASLPQSKSSGAVDHDPARTTSPYARCPQTTSPPRSSARRELVTSGSQRAAGIFPASRTVRHSSCTM
jgi:hypothetical protein